MYLAQLFDMSPFHHSAVEAKTANVIGLGYEFEESPKTLSRVEDVLSDSKKLEKIRKNITRGKSELKDYMESMNSDDGFLETLKRPARAYTEVPRKVT